MADASFLQTFTQMTIRVVNNELSFDFISFQFYFYFLFFHLLSFSFYFHLSLFLDIDKGCEVILYMTKV